MMTASIAQTHSSIRILLVEDNEISCQLMSQFLQYCGCDVLSLVRGSAFAAAMSSFRPHLVLLDLKLPDIDGFTLLQQVQQNPEWLQVPIIVVSAFAFQADKQRALSLGARRYLVKPVKLPQLKQAIDEELGYLQT